MSVQETILIKVDSNVNNNKFYKVVLHEGDTITTSWGRVGTENPASKTQPGGERRFNTIVRGKERRGYVKTNVHSTSPDKKTVDRKVLHEVASKSLAKDTDPALSSAISYMVDRNRHDIIETSGGMLKVDDSGVVKTALGIVGEDSIKAANNILDKVSQVKDKDAVSKLTNEYLSLVPQKVKGRDWAETFFDDGSKIVEQKNLLRQLRSSLDWYNAQDFTDNDETVNTDDFQNVFNVKLNTVAVDGDVFRMVDELYKKTRNSRHHRDVLHLGVKNVYELTYSDDVNSEFDELSKELGNQKLLWHGTDAGNVLSILREGLYCPPLNNSKFIISGRMFSNGIYCSDQGSKSIRYSAGRWNGQNNDRCFMFLADVVMGNEYWPNRDKENNYQFNAKKAHNGEDGTGRKFNSISVKGGTCGVLNNEMIVWNTKQIRLKYLVEFNK